MNGSSYHGFNSGTKVKSIAFFFLIRFDGSHRLMGLQKNTKNKKNLSNSMNNMKWEIIEKCLIEFMKKKKYSIFICVYLRQGSLLLELVEWVREPVYSQRHWGVGFHRCYQYVTWVWLSLLQPTDKLNKKINVSMKTKTGTKSK